MAIFLERFWHRVCTTRIFGSNGARPVREHLKTEEKMRAPTVTRWLVGGFLIAGVALVIPVAALADDAKDIQKNERQLQAEAKKVDADAARAASTPDGQRRLDERLAKQFNVDPSVVTGLRNRNLSPGQATIALALSQQLMKQDTTKTLTQQQALDKIMTERQAGKGWGVIAHELGLKLGHVVSEVKKADKAADHIAGKPDKPEHVAKVDKPDKPEKPARPEKPGR